jgi:protein-ribulosamine 3-kinase
MNESIVAALKHELGKQLNQSITALTFKPVSGGSINQVYNLSVNNSYQFCCKVNIASKFPGMFLAEKSGLELLGAQGIIKVPEVITQFLAEEYQLLVLEWITQGERTNVFWQTFGARLAQLHHVKGTSYGLQHDNYMGALVQQNKQDDDWSRFFFQQRLVPQLKIAVDKKLLTATAITQAGRIEKLIREEFPDTVPSLQHGDLWSGNFLCDHEGVPVLIDPAIYYGHPAVDLGLSTLFGGFNAAFYDAYNHHNPFPSNHKTQWELCNLYPLLIHLNLFGRGYLGDVTRLLEKYG